jgi:hypothetical protein
MYVRFDNTLIFSRLAMQTIEKLKERGRLGDLGMDGKIT